MALQQETFETVEKIEAATSLEKAWKQFIEFCRSNGLAHGAVAEIPSVNEDLEDTIYAMDWPPEWRRLYLERNYLPHDPAVLHMAHVSRAYTWEEALASRRYSKSQIRIVEEATDFGLKQGVVVPIGGLQSGAAVVTVSGESKRISQEQISAIHLCAIYLHAKLRALTGIRRSHLKDLPLLAPRERECLTWVAAGKTDEEIGVILDLSAKTVNAHVERAKQRLMVGTRMQAVVYAMRSGLIIV